MSPMEGESILMNQRQSQTWHLMKMVEIRKITLKEARKRMRKCMDHR